MTFESTLMPDVHVIGDSCQLTPLPKSAFAAQAQARACALAMVELLQERTPSPARLINHCYSLTAPDQAISVSGVYRIMGPPDQIEAIVTAESQPGDNAYLEARYARDWYDLILGETFGSAPLGVRCKGFVIEGRGIFHRLDMGRDLDITHHRANIALQNLRPVVGQLNRPVPWDQ